MVLLHGFPQAGSSWDELTPTLTAAGYRVLAPDQRGYASSALPKGRRAYRLPNLVADVEALLDAADVDQAHIVGHDWGGAVAWALAAKAPERVLSLSVLTTPHPAAMARSMVTSNQAAKSWYMLFFQLPWLPEKLLDPGKPASRKRFVQSLQTSGQDKASAERDADLMAEPGVLTGALNWYRAVPLSKPTGPVDVPTLYVWANGDVALGRKAAELTARYVKGPYTFKEIASSHWVTADDITDLLLPHLAANARV